MTKKILTILCLLASVCQVQAGEPTSDRVFASSLAYDDEYELYYFDVMLEGANLYTAYGMDIQLPIGMEVVDDGETIYVLMNDPMYPQNKLTKKYSHSVTPAFPYAEDHSHLRVGCISTKNEDMTSTSGALFRVYVTINYEENAWPIGSIKVYDAELNKVGQPYDAPDTETIVPLHTGETTLTFNVSDAAKWSTCILPFSASIPEGVKAYTCSSNDEDYIYLTEAESFAAYTPYILYAENGYSGTVSGTVEATIPDEAKSGVVESGYLSGAIVPQTATEGYVLQKQDEGVKFYAIGENDSFTIPAGKCWLKMPNDGYTRFYGFKFEETTSVSEIPTVQSSSLPSFDLSGHCIQNGKGVIIREGNKVLNP